MCSLLHGNEAAPVNAVLPLQHRDAADREASISKIHVGRRENKGGRADSCVW